MDGCLDHYVPRTDKPTILHTSGGRSSMMMLRMVQFACGGKLPDHVIPVFTNTGKERDETLDFIQECDERWHAGIVWLEYTYRSDMPGGRGPERQKNWYRCVDYETAARNGRPFEELLESRCYLPNVTRRICTSELKSSTCSRWVRDTLPRPWQKCMDGIGFRFDEPKRWKRAIDEHCRMWFPLALDCVTAADVIGWWRVQPFDLQIDSDHGNCDLCFLKGARKLRRLIAEDPARADWWIARENSRKANNRTTSNESEMQFSKRWSYKFLRDSPPLPDFDADGPAASCFCGD